MLRVACVTLAALACGGCATGGDRTGATQQPVVLTLGDPENGVGDAVPFAREVERLSAGSLRVRLENRRRNGRAEPEHEFINDVIAGRVELGVVASRAWDAAGAPSFRALGAPLLIDSLGVEDAVLRSDVTAPMLRSLRPLGLTGIGMVEGPLRRPFGLTRPLAAPADYRAAAIGTGQSLLAETTMRALGATAINLPIAAPRDQLDGIEAFIGQIQGNGYDAGGGYLTTNIVLWPRPLVLFANTRRFEALTKAQRNILLRAAASSLDAELIATADSDRDDGAILCRRAHVRYVTGDPLAMRRAVASVYRRLERDPATRAALTTIEEIKRARHQPVTEVPACDAPRTPSATGLTPVDGVYRMVTSIARDSRDDPEPVPENYGLWTYVFTRGRFAFTQQNTQACTWGYGTYTVANDRFEWHFTDGGGIAPNNAYNRPGEVHAFRWNLYHDTMTLRHAAGASSPTNFFLKPWRRIATEPTRRYFSKRCPPPGGALPE